MRPVLGLAGALSIAGGCGGSGAPAVAPSAIGQSEALPVGYESLGAVVARCRTRPAFGELRGAPATSLGCSRAELARALRELAAAKGASVVAGQSCRQTEHTLSCVGEAARPAEHTRAPSAAANHDEPAALPVSVAERIAIDLEPSVPRFSRRPRSADDVTEYRLLPVGHIELGTLRARCAADECSAQQAQEGLRFAAGGLGASALVAPSCFVLEGERACVGTLAATERDPETEPLAR
jgi:hypothetical protein